MVVCFQQHEVLGSVSVPDEDVAAVRAAHYKVVAPETRLLNLERQNTKSRFHRLTAEVKSEFNVTIYSRFCSLSEYSFGFSTSLYYFSEQF